jgi:cobalt-zinc-cadmium efflux system protein
MKSEHDHADHTPNDSRAFAIGLILNLCFVIAEAGFGLWADSLALLADAGHNLSDVAGLLLAWVASVLSRRRPSRRRTYGWRRSSILAAMLNSVILFVVAGGIMLEAIQRLRNPEPVMANTMLLVAAVGIAVNTATALLFSRGRKKDLNIRAAFLHMASDAGVSAGVVFAGATILITGWVWVDPAVSLAVVAVILFSTWGLLMESMNLALDAVPEDIDTEAVKQYLLSLPGVVAVHDLHIWGLSTTETALTVHLVKPETEGDDELLERARKDLRDHYKIRHITLQWEREGGSYQCEIRTGDPSENSRAEGRALV